MLLREYADTPTRDLVAKIGRSRTAIDQAAFKRGMSKSPQQRARSQARTTALLCEAGTRHRRRKGEPPWNKGRPFHAGGRAPETQFRPGHRPQTWQPIGTERINKDGLLTRKVADTRNRRVDWKPVHVIEWEAANGPVPAGQIVLTTGELVTRAELMRRNTVHRMPKELALAVQLVGALNRQIRKRA